MIPGQQLSKNDQQMIALLRRAPSMTVCELTEAMGVTATAVRQRLNRLMALRLVERSHAVEGRGRPSYHYLLTEDGHRSSANNFGDLAVVLWQEVQKIPDVAIRQQVISGAVERLAKKYEMEASGATIEARMQSVVKLFADRQIAISLETSDGLPVIKVDGCPYPTLAQDSREICDMEKEMLSKVIGKPIDRCQCRQDGDDCCSYRAEPSLVGKTTSKKLKAK